jgi:N-acetylmuramoyl-L-alanine amidase
MAMAMLAPGIPPRSGRRPKTDLMQISWHPSPNFGPRRNDLTPTLIVIHYTAMASAGAALDRLCDREVEVSAHYLIGCDGTIWQMVNENMRAWHAGAGEWADEQDINSRSIGVELDNRGDHPFAEAQMHALEVLLTQIMPRWGIEAAGVIGHSDMAPGRKCDPGPRFDWARLARQGLALWPANCLECEPDSDRFRVLAQQAGFTAKVNDADLLCAVRLRFRPWGQGPLAGEDMAVLTMLPNQISREKLV